MVNEKIIISTKYGNRITTKTDILIALNSFDEREPDKTISLWDYMAKWLYANQELKTDNIV